jgi:hypothetical protein
MNLRLPITLSLSCLLACGGEDQNGDRSTFGATSSSGAAPAPLIMVAIDSLHPAYLELDRNGDAAGSPGNWLMPNVRKFLEKATWYPRAKCYLPSATDMNHVNALAGTSSGQTGIVGVSSQMKGWDSDGKPVIESTSMSWPRDDQGRPVDTLFHAWKRTFPHEKTAFVAGKGWVAEMFDVPGKPVDFIVTGDRHPSYVAKPLPRSYTDPPTDLDGRCDPESNKQRLLASIMELAASHAPSDRWTVNATLKVLDNEAPSMVYVLMAQLDDIGHALGAAHDPNEFVPKYFPYKPDAPLCIAKPRYQLVSSRDRRIYREAILDAVRDVDFQFGRLIWGLEQRGIRDKANIVVLSDHAMVTHLYDKLINPKATDLLALLEEAKLVGDEDFVPYTATSIGALYWRDKKWRVPLAKKVLESHTARNPQTGVDECPWYVLDRNDMKNGVPGVALPGELYHKYFVETDKEQSLVWPDLALLARSGFQLPAYSALVNLGVDNDTGVPFDASINIFVGGPGSVDTQPIMMAFGIPGGSGKVLQKATRIGDIAATMASIYGLQLTSTVIGADLSGDL